MQKNVPVQSVGTRLLLYMLGVAILAALLEVSAMIYWQRHLDREVIIQDRKDIPRTFTPVLKENLWLGNREQTQLLLNGIVQSPEVQRAVVRTVDGSIFVSAGVGGSAMISPFLVPLTRAYKGQEVELGRLEIYFRLPNVYDQLFEHGLPLFVSQVILTCCIALSFFFLFNFLVTKHLRRIAKYFEKFDVELPSDILQLERRQKGAADELDLLVSSINSMSARLLDNQSEQTAMFHSLEKSYERIREQIQEVWKAKEILAESERKNATILDRSIDGFWIVDQAGNITSVNESFCAIVGYSREELLSMNIADLEVSESKAEIEEHIRKVIREGKDRFETRHRRKDGHIVDVEVSVNFDTSLGNIFFSFMHDISARKQAEEELRLQAQIISSMEEGVYLVRAADGIIVFASRKFEEMFGYDPGEMLGAHVSIVNAPGRQGPEEIAREIMGILEKAGNWQGDVENIKKDGTTFWCHAKVYKFKHSVHGDVLVSVHSDITAHKASLDAQARLEKQLRQAQKMQALGTLAGGIAHEFNNFLGIIILNGEMIADRLSSSDLAKRQIERILKAGQQAKRLISQILAFSRESSQRRVPVMLPQLVREIMGFLETTLPTSIAVIQEIGAEDCSVLVDSDEIHQVLINLCANAAQAMQEKGTLTLMLESVTVSANDIRSGFGLHEGRYAKLSISDTGTGMDQETLERACDPFFTTKEVGKGTGMGLALVYGIMERCNGTVRLESTPGKGTTVHLFFPIIAPEGLK